MTNQLRPVPANQPSQPDRIVIELDVATIKRLCHALGAHCPFNECFKDILYLTRVCEDAEDQYKERVQEKLKAEAKGNAIREYLTEEAAKKILADAKAAQDDEVATTAAVDECKTVEILNVESAGPVKVHRNSPPNDFLKRPKKKAE